LNRFDKEALSWDDLPRRVELAKAVVREVKDKLKKDDKVLDFGCGTGLVGLNLAPFVKEVVGIDTSLKMVERFNEKAKLLNLNAKAFKKDIFEVDEVFDVAVSSMTIHHIKDLNALSMKLQNIANKIFIADLCKEDGTFHDHGNEGVEHFGFLKKELFEIFRDFDLEYRVIHTIKKGENREYPVFLLELTKRR